MREALCIGILRETKLNEKRAPLTPLDVSWLVKRGLKVEVESSSTRIFKDVEYEKTGAKVLKKLENATFMVGIKEPRVEELYENATYMVFSHTAKGQSPNMPLLRAFLEKNITLIDYEKIVNSHGSRLIYFGRFAGICGLIDSLCYFGKKMEWKGIKNPFSLIQPAHKYGSFEKAKSAFTELDKVIANKGFGKALSPFIIGINGHGRVSGGVQEILQLLNPMEIHPRDMVRFVKHHSRAQKRIHKIIFLREEKFRSKDGKGFYFEKYLKYPKKFISNLDSYLPYINLLLHTSYWDSRYPRIVTKKMIDRLSRQKPFRLEFIGDISCDIKGSVELTHKATTKENPVFTYDTKSKSFADGYKKDGISILAIDNLPSELPRDASGEFSNLIRDYVYQVAAHGVRDITNHVAVPTEIRRGVITENGKLTKDFRYLAKCVKQKNVLQF